MDAADWEDLAARPYGLLIMLQHRLGGEQAELFHELIEAREYGLALEEIASALAQDKIAITDQEHGDMLGRVAQLGANGHSRPAIPSHTRYRSTWSDGTSSHVRDHPATPRNRLTVKQVYRNPTQVAGPATLVAPPPSAGSS